MGSRFRPVQRLMAWWDGLSSSELQTRLEQRGLPSDEAQALVRERDDDPEVRQAITKVLDG